MILDEMMIFSEKERRKKATKVWLPFFSLNFEGPKITGVALFFLPTHALNSRNIFRIDRENGFLFRSWIDFPICSSIFEKKHLEDENYDVFFQINSKTHPFFSTHSILKSIFWGVDEIYLRSVSKVEFIWHQTKWFWVHSACKTFRYF